MKEYVFILVVHCEWNPWKYANCSLECGGGKLIQYRTPSILAKHGGRNCSGKTRRLTNIECNDNSCSGKMYISNDKKGKCIIALCIISHNCNTTLYI